MFRQVEPLPPADAVPSAVPAADLVEVRASRRSWGISVPATASSLRTVRRLLGDWLGTVGCPPSIAQQVVFSVDEAVGNAIQHASGSGGDRVRVDAVVVAGTQLLPWCRVRLVITYGGRGPDPGEWTARLGLQVMRAFMDDVAARADAGGTVVEMASPAFAGS